MFGVVGQDYISGGMAFIGSEVGNYPFSTPEEIGVAYGNPIEVTDSSEKPIKGLNLYGKSTQAKTTGAQLFDKSTAIPNKYIDELTGLAHDGDKMHISDYIDVSGINYIKCTNTNSSQWMAFYDSEKTYISGKNGYFEEIQVPENAVYARFTIINEFVDKFMLNEGTTAKPYEPYTGGKPSPSPDYPQEIESAGDDGEITVDVTGKNLVDIADISKGDGFVAYDVLIDRNIIVSVKEKPSKIISNVWRLSFTLRSGEMRYISDGKFPKSILVSKENPIVSIGARDIYIEEGKYSGFMVEYGRAATSYEPYKPIQTLTIPTPNGLPGIPVNSGGNYTDENGQQWVCDTIEYRDGQAVHVQRCYEVELNAGNLYGAYGSKQGFSFLNVLENAHTPREGFCDSAVVVGGNTTTEGVWLGAGSQSVYWLYNPHYDDTLPDKGLENFRAWIAEHPVRVITYRNEPIITPITDTKVLSILKSLHTNKPTTIITTGDYIGIKLEYVVDTR